MEKKAIVEFRYVDRESCSRCKKTAENVEKACLGLMKKGVAVAFKEKKLPLSRLSESNSVWINGRDLMDLLEKKDAVRKKSRCYGCSRLMQRPCECRTYAYRGKRYPYITQSMVREGITGVLGA